MIQCEKGRGRRYFQPLGRGGSEGVGEREREREREQTISQKRTGS